MCLISAALVLAACGGSDEAASDGAANGSTEVTEVPLTDQTADVTVSGDLLPAFPEGVQVTDDPSADPAIGTVAPTLTGTNFAGESVAVEPGGSATVVMFVAHWCSHCQREVPVVQQMVDDGKLPAGVELVAVSTAVREGDPEYPPQSWLAEEGWTSSIMRDSAANDAVLSYGAGGFPYVVYLDADNVVVARSAGELAPSMIESLWLAAAGS
jgi:thiol-disulfide isomerase/thioredoxin